MIYDYENLHIINNNNFISHSPIVNKKNTTKVTKILDTYPITITDNNYCNQNNINSENAAFDAASKICQKYEVPYDKAQYEIRANTGKKVFKIMMGN